MSVPETAPLRWWSGPLAPFAVRSFRFQWPADLLMSWAFEMENLILGWFILTETNSVSYLTYYGALLFVGTLLAPSSGVLGDRIGRRSTLCLTRAFLACLASIVMTLAFVGWLKPIHVLPIALFIGLVRPSDLVMRNALIGDTMIPSRLMSALGLSRMTMDSARIFGSLAGAGLFSHFGIGYAYMGIVMCYIASFLLTLGVQHVPAANAPHADGRANVGTMLKQQWADLREGLIYAWQAPAVTGLMLLAFLLNFSAFPLCYQLLAHVAKNIYGIDATGLGDLVSAFASGALIGSLIMTMIGGENQSSRFMLIMVIVWYLIILVFAQIETKISGMMVLFVMGIVHNLAMVSLSAVLLRDVEARFRARVMGIRMLVVYGLPLGLLGAGVLIERFSYPTTADIYITFGIAVTVFIAYHWRQTLWRNV
jgi:predicted MFS family arabinose efflux permease